MSSRYDRLNKEALLRLLEARDQREANRFGQVLDLGVILGVPASTLESKIRGLKNRETSMQGPDGQFFEAFPSRSATASA